MTQPFYLLMGLHNHQPVGNFDSVIEETYQLSYKPFIDVLERFPKVRVSLHFTGCLLDYLIPHHPEFIERLRALGERGQIEFMTGGYYEPILAIIPDDDKIGQIEKLSDTVEKYFGQRPVGMWLAERVWEPHLPAAMAKAGVKYCVLDDTHFTCAGLDPEDCHTYYLTDEAGHSLALMPTLAKLRYTMPFEEPEATIAYMREQAEKADRPLIGVYGDDGEKFGGWPRTYKHCFEDGWLERFFTTMEAHAEEFPMIHLREALDLIPPAGRIYLPTASYFEMMKWALPTQKGLAYETAEERIKECNLSDEVGAFFRGGFWRNFLAKYPEINQIHKKMFWISSRLSKALAKDPKDKTLLAARDHLWAGQCNCSYWHGVFGGLYLGHLRDALHHNLNIANRLIGEYKHGKKPWLNTNQLDFDLDGSDEILIQTDQWMATCAPHLGGALTELDFKPRDMNLVNTVARREEPYHKLVAQAELETEENATGNIHGTVMTKELGLERLLCYDGFRRLFGQDHFLPIGTSVEDFRDNVYHSLGDTRGLRYAPSLEEKDGKVQLKLEAPLQLTHEDGAVSQVQLHKTYTFRAGKPWVKLAYTLENTGETPVSCFFGPEMNINLLAGDAHDRNAWVDGAELHEPRLNRTEATFEVQRFGLTDEWLDLTVAVELSQPAMLYRTAIETVSFSEGGLERNYQGTTLLPLFQLQLGPGERFTCELKCKATAAIKG